MVCADLNIFCPSQTEAVIFESELVEIDYWRHRQKRFPRIEVYGHLYQYMKRLPGMWYQVWPKEMNKEFFDIDDAKSLSRNRKRLVRVEDRYREIIPEIIRFYATASPKQRTFILIRLSNEGRTGDIRPTVHRKRIPTDMFLTMLLSGKEIEFNTVYTIILFRQIKYARVKRRKL